MVVQQGFSWVSPETGSQEAFAPARALYGVASFVVCAAFGRYLPFRCPGPYGSPLSPPSKGARRGERLALAAGRLALACSGGVGGEPGGVQVGEGAAAAVPHEVVASA